MSNRNASERQAYLQDKKKKICNEGEKLLKRVAISAWGKHTRQKEQESNKTRNRMIFDPSSGGQKIALDEGRDNQGDRSTWHQ